MQESWILRSQKNIGIKILKKENKHSRKQMIIKVIEKSYINNKNDIVDNYRLKTENDSCTKVAVYISLTPTK